MVFRRAPVLLCPILAWFFGARPFCSAVGWRGFSARIRFAPWPAVARFCEGAHAPPAKRAKNVVIPEQNKTQK